MIMIKIILVVAHIGFQPLEYSIPKELLTKASLQIITASNQVRLATNTLDKKASVDITLNQATPKQHDALFFIGGPRALDNIDNSTSYKAIKEWSTSGKPFGAICISPRILAHAGILNGKKETGWDDDHALAGIFKKYDVEYIQNSVVVDGNMVTVTGPMATQEQKKL